MNRYDFGVIGNCSYLAYIDKNANVNWLCMPRFDSSFVFGSILDKKKGGEFSITPAAKDFHSKQYYLTNTNILATEFEMDEGRYRVLDFAPRFYRFDRYFKPLMLFRKIELLDGNPFIKVKCHPMGEYGESTPQVVAGSNHIGYLNLSNPVRLTSDIPLNYILTDKSFLLNDSHYLVFSFGEPLEAPLAETSESFLKKTTTYWLDWVKTTFIPTIFQDEVIRSALVLKLHQYEDTGAVIASGMTSLPEFNGSGRTWDYRYCWMRDTYYTLNSFHNIGHFEELEKYSSFIQNVIMNEKHRVKPLYTILGGPVPHVKELPLEGYLRNQPVRIGNDAVKQVQNDVYGQILISLLPLIVDKRLNYFDKKRSDFITAWLLKRIDEHMDLPDSGLWEFGNTYQFHCYTYLFHWAGAKAAFKIGKFLGNDSIIYQAESVAARAVEYIEKCYNPKIKAYTQAIGTAHLDASSLQLITMNYLDPSGDRARLHLEAHERELFNTENLYFRYTHDELGKAETSFIICGFWYAEALAATGQTEKASMTIEKLLKCTNHLGLFSEDADENFGQWGNFPQTYSHVGLINSIYRLALKIDNPLFL